MSRIDDEIKAMNFQYPEFIPVTVGLLPATWKKHREKLNDLCARHPLLFDQAAIAKSDYDDIRGTYVRGDHVDAWGCVWSNIKDGMEAMVKEHPLPTRETIRTLKAPAEDIGTPHGFMYLRLADLRGFENLMIDFAEEPPELQMLIDIVCDYNVRQINLRLQKEKPANRIMGFGDDLGTQIGLAISPALWRKYLKPCFMKLYALVHNAGYSVYMHTDGRIIDIIPDLIECGVNVLNPQVRANGIDDLARVCKGKVCLNLDLDRQMFPFASPRQIDDHIRDVVEKLGSREGGLWLIAEIADDVPLENVEAICRALEEYRGYWKN